MLNINRTLILGLLLGITACTPATETKSDAEPITESAAESITQPETETAPEPSSVRNGTEKDSAEEDNAEAGTDKELCDEAFTQPEMNDCAKQAYAEADAELNKAYQTLDSKLSKEAQQALTTAELAWIDFRDQDCAFDRAQFEGGSIEPLIYHSCLEAHTLKRLRDLRQPAVPTQDYDSADAQLNQEYQALLGLLSSQQQDELGDAQLAWIEYRDRSCAFEANHHPIEITETQCLTRLSETRTQKIRQAIEQRSL